MSDAPNNLSAIAKNLSEIAKRERRQLHESWNRLRLYEESIGDCRFLNVLKYVRRTHGWKADAIEKATPGELSKLIQNDVKEAKSRFDKDSEVILTAQPVACAENGKETPAKNQPDFDETAFVPAKTLREQREMNAANCNKFLKQYGTTSAQSVEGKVRYHKPNKKRLDIHAADWLKFWQDIDRRQSDALDEDSMQEFLANAEAEKDKVKAKRKVGRASSRQVS